MKRYWEDVKVGETFTTEPRTIEKKDILDFANEFDPQPYHLDSAAADASIFGGLCASGWQVSALMMRLLTEALHQQNIAIFGVAGVPDMRWKLPVFSGDSLAAKIILVATNPDSGRTGMGSIDAEVEVSNQDGQPVIKLVTRLLIGHREEVCTDAG
ncbi:MAG: acyl dehydratase [Halieaceae bacterium]|jgi:acyl dehydratase